MRLEKYEQLVQNVNDADLVLVGLGEEWVLTEDLIKTDLEKKQKTLYEMFLLAQKSDKYRKALPLLTALYCKKYIPKKLDKAYDNLRELLKDKNYFIVSLTVDSYLKYKGFKEGRYVNPCGSYEKLQCEIGCSDYLEASEVLLEQAECIVEEEMTKRDSQMIEQKIERCCELLEATRCNSCDSIMNFNLLDTIRYREEGYLEQWQTYMKWLQGTLNKKLCVIEAGVGMKLPSVIRWPFEKTVFYNQKANMIRIHRKFYQVNEEVSERAYGCESHAVEVFSEKNVEAYS